MKRRPYAVTPGLREVILLRDKACFLSKVEPGHVCRDIFGNQHRPDDLDKLTLEHVKDASMMGKRAPSDERHLVALCGAANFGVPNRSQRDSMRAYLRAVTA